MDWENRTASLLLCLSILLAAIHNGLGDAERKVVCYYTNWSIYRPGTAKFSPQNINPYLCTHLIYAFGGFTKDNALKPFDKYQDIEKGGYAKFTGLKTYNKNLKTLLAIGGWNEGSSRFSPMVADAGRRREFVKNSIKFLRKNHFDGLDLDWEYPAFRDGGKPRDKDNYASLVQELREEFERESSKTGRPRLLLTMAMPAGIEYIDKGYDVPRLNEYLDFINLLSYDYHSSYEPAVNHHSPLYPLEEDNEYNYDSELTIDYTIDYLLKKGATPEKIVLGIPTYGRSYTLFNPDTTDLGSPADGPGIEGDATREKGYLAYYEICESLMQSDEWEVVQPNSKAMGPYAFKGDQWVGYDDEDIVKLKAKYANEKNLGGIMFWTIDNDDFRGKCHDRPYPLIEAAKEALLADSANAKTSSVESRKKPRIQNNAIGRKQIGGRSTTPAPKRTTTSRPKFRNSFPRPRPSVEDEDEEQKVDRRSYDQEEADTQGGNAIRATDKSERSGGKSSKPKTRIGSNRNRRKQNRRKEAGKNGSSEESLSNKLTTPQPPTTPDPGTDFKCQDEGFFPHPRDCKKYVWCLESAGLGVVAHHFTCPSGLVFNEAASSCDYPRNVICGKSEPSSSTTRAPITAATSRTTFLYSTTRQPTTEKPEEDEEDYEYEDEEEEEEDEEVEEEEKEEPKPATTPKQRNYKTITRNRPTSTTTTTTTTEAPSTPRRNEPERVLRIEDEEDPEVIKELIKLIKKAGGIEQLEKQLLFQGKSSEDATNTNNENATPATISRTLYERVLSRHTGRVANNKQASTNRNGPGGAQFEGLDEVPEVKSLRRSQKPQYVTIERPKPSTEEPSVRDEEEDEEEDEEDNADVASSEERAVSNSFLTSSTQRATPNYINIRRARPATSKDDNNVEEKNKNAEEETPVPRRAYRTEKSSEDTKNQESRPLATEDNSQTTKSRYVSIQRFRSTTPQTVETVSETSSPEPTTESTSEPPKVDQTTDTTQSSVPSSSSTSNDIPVDPETERPVVSSTVKLVEDTATEILLTTLSTPGTAAVSQPRPFSFNRRRPTTETTTEATTEASNNDQTRSKVAGSPEVNKLPTLKDLIGYRYDDRGESQTPVFFNLLPLKDKLDEEGLSRGKDANAYEDAGEKNKHVDLSVDDITYYVEDNVADDEESINKKRIDREDPSTTTLILVPTTMRGIPLADLLHSTAHVPRGFFVTRDENEKFEARTTDSTPIVTDDPTTETELKLNTEPSDSTVPTTEFTTKEIPTDDDTTLSTARTDSISSSSTEQSLLVTSEPENVTSSKDFADKDVRKKTVPDVVENKELSTNATTVPSDGITERTANRHNRRRQNIGQEFGRKSQGRQYTRPVSEESYIKTTERTQHARRRFSTRRGQQRRPPVTTTLVYETTVGSFYRDGDNETDVTGKVDQDLEQTTVLANETNNLIGTSDDRGNSSDEERGREIEIADAKNSVGRSSDRENLNGNETDFVPKASRTESIAGSEERLQAEENVRPEVNSSKNTVTSRTPGSSPTTRLRKPTILGGLTPYSKSSNTLANQRKIRPTDGNLTLVNKTLDAAGNKTEARKPVKDIDQSSRAQEIAVTLADPPSPQSSATGRPPFRNALRRKISTTVAPRATDATTNRSAVRFTPATGDRQRPKARDRSVENATTRPRRPPVLDYDYYADEEEPVVGKSTYNGKLFLTSTGTIKCLDQGNFPHPYSCKKFITCARMVNGLVVGAEYTCPDTLSFDPVGGICNWSAGLGCKE